MKKKFDLQVLKIGALSIQVCTNAKRKSDIDIFQQILSQSVTIAVEEFAKKVEKEVIGEDTISKDNNYRWSLNEIKAEQRQCLKLLVKQSK